MHDQSNSNSGDSACRESSRTFIIKRILSIILVLLILIPHMALIASATSDSTVPEDTTPADTFIVGMECGYSPFNWTQLDGSNGAVPISGTDQFANGYDVQIAKLIAEKMGKELLISKISWGGLVPSLTSGKIDAIVAGMSATAERKEAIDFSDNYYYSDLVVVIKTDGVYAGATTLEDLSGSKITGQLGTLHYDVIDQIPGVKKQVALEDFPNMIVALLAGSIDGYVSERPGALSAVAANSNLAFISFPAGEGFIFDDAEVSIGVGIKKDSPLTAQVNAALAEISDEQRESVMQDAIRTQPTSDDTTEDASGSAAVPGSDTAGESTDPTQTDSDDSTGLQTPNKARGFFENVVGIVKKYWRHFLRGAGTTLALSLIGTVIGLVIGVLVATFRATPATNQRGVLHVLHSILSFILTAYVEIIRGTPMMVQAMVFYYGFIALAGDRLTPFIAGIIILSFNTGAYMAEVVRGGIDSIDKGQMEAGKAIGMTQRQTMMSVILPQAIRNILPATGNEFVINIKDTSVFNVIAVTELYFASRDVQANTFQMFETYLITAVIYFVLTFTVTRILHLVERKMDGPSNFALTSSTTPTNINTKNQRRAKSYGEKYNKSSRSKKAVW